MRKLSGRIYRSTRFVATVLRRLSRTDLHGTAVASVGSRNMFSLERISRLCYYRNARISDGYTLSGVGMYPLLCIVRQDTRGSCGFPVVICLRVRSRKCRG